MKNKFKKILTSSIISAVSITAIGCSTTTNKLAKNIDKSMAEFVTSINKLDYVDTSSPDNKLGKIVETTAKTDTAYLTNTLDNLNVENTITRPSERTDNFKLFVLSSKPFITLTSDDNASSLEFSMSFSTEKIENTSDEICTKINTLILKRSILMIYVNEIYNGNVSLSEENKVAINAYVNVIKENTSFLNGNRGMVKNQLSLANDLVSSDNNGNLINYYIIKSGEALETRSSKIDSSISAIDSIISILETNLSPSSAYYDSKLSSTYENLISNISSSNENNSSDENKELAKKIADSLDFCFDTKNTTDKSVVIDNNDTNQNPATINNNIVKANDVTINSTNNRNQNQLTKDIKEDSNYIKNRYPNGVPNDNYLTNHNQNTNNTNINDQNNNTNTNRNQNNQITTLESKEKIRPTRRVRRNRNKTNKTVISTDGNTKSNSAKSVTKMENENQDSTMRATRKPTTNSTEEYISSNQTNSGSQNNRATRMPYSTENRF